MDTTNRDQLTALVRRRFRLWIVVLVVLGVQIAWTAHGESRYARSFGWGNTISFRNLGALPPHGYYVGNEAGLWLIWQSGWQAGNPAAANVPIRPWSRWGLMYNDARAVKIRVVGLNAQWTIALNAIVVIAAGVRWRSARRRMLKNDPAYARGFEIATA